MALELIIKSPVGFDPAVYNWPNVRIVCSL